MTTAHTLSFNLTDMMWNTSLANESLVNESFVNESLVNKSLDNESGFKACRMYDFIIEAVFMGLLCLFGFAGNTLSILCLKKEKSKTATPLILISLEVADTLFLITVLILRVLTSVNQFTGYFDNLTHIFAYIGKFGYPCALIAETGTIYLTILVTVNRFISVCKPYEALDLCSIQTARKQILIVAIFSIICNVPRFFEYEVRLIEEDGHNRTVSLLSVMGENKIYQVVYGNGLYFVIMFLIPLISLTILNWKLIIALRETRVKRSQLLHSESSRESKSEYDITLMLIVVVVVFVLCQTPALITQVLMNLLDRERQLCPSLFFYYERISDLLVVANSALNFIIYCFCSTKFRQILVVLICGKTIESPEPSHVPKVGRPPSKNGFAPCDTIDTNV